MKKMLFMTALVLCGVATAAVVPQSQQDPNAQVVAAPALPGTPVPVEGTGLIYRQTTATTNGGIWLLEGGDAAVRKVAQGGAWPAYLSLECPTNDIKPQAGFISYVVSPAPLDSDLTVIQMGVGSIWKSFVPPNDVKSASNHAVVLPYEVVSAVLRGEEITLKVLNTPVGTQVFTFDASNIGRAVRGVGGCQSY